jgi:ribosomal protein S18 acetylase RimI-like enzyme
MLSIRRGRATDLPTVYLGELDYIRQIEPQNEERWNNAIALHLEQWTAALKHMFVAEIGDRIVGYCFWEDHGDEAVLASIYVSPDHRRQGIGRDLLKRFIADAKRRKTHNATLGVQSQNPARLLYEKMGFVRTHYTEGFLHYRRALI